MILYNGFKSKYNLWLSYKNHFGWQNFGQFTFASQSPWGYDYERWLLQAVASRHQVTSPPSQVAPVSLDAMLAH